MNSLPFEYSVEFSERKTISIIVERDRRVIVRAPNGTSNDFVRTQLQKRKRSIVDKISHNQKYPAVPPIKEFVSGESLLYLGKHYKLFITDNEMQEIIFDSKFFISRQLQAKANSLFKRWYKSEAERVIIPKVYQLAEKIGVKPAHVTVKDLKYRWGSCTPKDKIHFNWRLIKAPIYVIEYIIVHELTHLLVANHTPEFWNRVGVQLPSYDKAKQWLRVNGGELEVDF